MPQAHMADGAVLDFPEGTSPEVIDRVAKEYVRKGAGRPVETAVGGGGRPVETSRAPTLDLAPVPRAVPIPVSAPLSAGLTTVPAGPTGTMPSGAPQPGEGIYRFMEAPLGAPEEPETRGAVLRNIPRTLAGLPLAIGSLPVTAPARAWGEGPAEAAKQIATTLPIPGVAETVAAMEARPGERVEAAIRQFGRSGGLDLPLAVLAAHGMGRGITEGAARYVGEPLAEAGARGVEGLAREREVVGQYPMPAGPRVATPVEAGRLLMAPSRRGPAVETPYEALRRLRTGIPPSEEGRTYGAMPVPPAGAPPLPPEPPPSPAVPPRPATTEAVPALAPPEPPRVAPAGVAALPAEAWRTPVTPGTEALAEIQSAGLPRGVFYALDRPFESAAHETRAATRETLPAVRAVFDPDGLLDPAARTRDRAVHAEMIETVGRAVRAGADARQAMTDFLRSRGYDAYVRGIDGDPNNRELIAFGAPAPETPRVAPVSFEDTVFHRNITGDRLRDEYKTGRMQVIEKRLAELGGGPNATVRSVRDKINRLRREYFDAEREAIRKLREGWDAREPPRVAPVATSAVEAPSAATVPRAAPEVPPPPGKRAFWTGGIKGPAGREAAIEAPVEAVREGRVDVYRIFKGGIESVDRGVDVDPRPLWETKPGWALYRLARNESANPRPPPSKKPSPTYPEVPPPAAPAAASPLSASEAPGAEVSPVPPAPRAPGWLGSLDPAARERVFAVMRRADERVQTGYAEATAGTPAGRVPVGSEASRHAVVAGVEETYIHELNRGATPDEALARSIARSREFVANHNAKRPRDVNWVMSPEEGASPAMSIHRAIRSAIGTAPELPPAPAAHAGPTAEIPGRAGVSAEPEVANGGAPARPIAAKGEKGFIEGPSANDAARFAKTMILKGPINATNDLLERHLFGPAFEAVRSRIPEAIRTPIAKRLLDARAGQPAFMRGLVQARDAAMSTDYQRVEDLYNGLSKTPKADQPLLWKAINGLDSIEPGTPEWGVLAKNREAVDAAQAFHHEMGGAAVEYGLMSKPSFDAYDGHYQHLVAASAAPFRSRGSGGVPGLQPALRSDYGVFQHRTGEGTYIEDARVSLTEGAPQMIHAVRTAELLREVQDKPDLYRPLGEVHLRAMRAEIETARASGADPAMVQKGEANLAEFAAERDRLIAAGWRELPESPRLRSTYMNAPKAFDLSGGLAAPGAFEDVSTLARMMDDAEIAKAALLSAWKGGMVANFVTEMGNLMSAARNADVKAGIPLSRQVSLLPMAVREMVARGPLFREALKAGVFRGAFMKADIDAMGEAIDTTLAERHRAGGELAWYARYALNLRKAMARFPVSRLYQANDNAFKMMIYMTERELGRSPEEAAKLAQETEHDYGTVGTWTQAARSHWWALPFVSYTAKQLPFELKAMATRPLATLKWWFIVDALKNAVARARGETDAEQRKRERIVEHRAPGRLALPSTQGALEAAVGGDRRVPYTDLTQVMGFAPRVGRFTFGEAPFVPTGVAFNPRLPWQLSQPAYRAREGAMPGPFAPMMTPAAVLAVEAATKLDPRTGQRIAPAGSTAAQETGAFGTEAATSLLPSLLVRQPVEAARILSGKKSRDIYGHREDRARQLWNTFMAPKAYKTNASDIARGMRKGLKIEMKEARRPSGELRMMSPAKRHDERQAERERKRALKLELRSVLHGP